MPKKKDTFTRDSDLDERPFGDSHFGNVGRDRRRLEKPRPPDHEARDLARVRRGDPVKAPPLSVYSWHEGFEDLDLAESRRVRSTIRQRARRPEPTG